MNDDQPPVWKRNEPDSPCIQVCVIEPHSKLCLGCYRTADEIAAWAKMDGTTRRALIAQLPQRANQIKPKRRGGRLTKR